MTKPDVIDESSDLTSLRPRCCEDLPELDQIKPGFTLELREPVPLGEGVPPVQQVVFRALRFSDLAGPMDSFDFEKYRHLIQRSTRQPPSVIDSLGLEDAYRAMWVVNAFLLPLRQ